MPYEDWWWDVVKSDPEGDEEIVGRKIERYKPGEDPRYNPSRETEEEPELVNTDAIVANTPFAGTADRTPDVGNPRVETSKERKAREKKEREERNRENYVQGGYADIELDDPRAKKEGWWGRLKQKDINPISRAKNLASNIAPKATANVAEKMPKAVRALGTEVSLDDIDRATDQPGTKASRAIDRTKRNIGQKWQDRVKRRAKEGDRPLFNYPSDNRRKREKAEEARIEAAKKREADIKAKQKKRRETAEANRKRMQEEKAKREARIKERQEQEKLEREKKLEEERLQRKEEEDRRSAEMRERLASFTQTEEPPTPETPEAILDAPDQLAVVEANEAAEESLADIYAGHKNPNKDEQARKIGEALNVDGLDDETRQAYRDIKERLEQSD